MKERTWDVLLQKYRGEEIENGNYREELERLQELGLIEVDISSDKPNRLENAKITSTGLEHSIEKLKRTDQRTQKLISVALTSVLAIGAGANVVASTNILSTYNQAYLGGGIIFLALTFYFIGMWKL
jgi:hypothetical protein